MKRVALLAALMMIGCSLSDPQPGKVSQLIGKEIREKGLKEIDIAQLTDFDWEELYLFGPYQDREHICAALNLKGADCERVVPQFVEEENFLLVFQMYRKVVHAENHRRFYGDFSGARLHQPILKSEARFSVRQGSVTTGKQIWLHLEPSNGANSTAKRGTRR